MTLREHLPVVVATLQEKLGQIPAPAGTLQDQLAQHGAIFSLRAGLAAYEAALLARIPDLAVLGKLPAPISAAAEAQVAALQQALGHSMERSEKSVGEALLVPVAARMVEYAQWDLWGSQGEQQNAGAANSAASAITSSSSSRLRPTAYGSFSAGEVSPSDVMRSVCEALMEVPLLLEAVNVESSEMQLWLARVVDESIHALSKTLGGIVILRSGASSAGGQQAVAHALDQLATDVEYFQNVLNAVADGPFPQVTRIRDALRKEHEKWCSLAPGFSEVLTCAISDALRSV
jgi:hypothetical protein